MKFTIKQADFARAIKTAMTAVGGKSTLPVLSHLHLLVDDEAELLRLTGTNLELWSQADAVLDGDAQPGDVTLPAQTLAALIASYPADTIITIHAETTDKATNKVFIEAGWNVSQMLGFPGEEFPDSPDVKEECAFSIAPAILAKLVRGTIYAASTDPSRMQLTALSFEVRMPLLGDKTGDDVLVVTASDTHRLVCRQAAIRQTMLGGGQWMVPAAVAHQIVGITEKDEGDLLFSCAKGMLRVMSASGTFTTRLVEGIFPNYERLLPQHHDRTITPTRAELIAALKRIQLFSADLMNRAVFDLDGARLTLSGVSSTIGEAKETLDVAQEGGDTQFAVNARYLIQALQAESSESVRFECTEPLRPFVVVPHGETDSDVRGVQLLMPMQVL